MTLTSRFWLSALLALTSLSAEALAVTAPTAPSAVSVLATTLTGDGTTTNPSKRGFRLSWTDNSNDENLFQITAQVGSGTETIVAYTAANTVETKVYLSATALPAGTRVVFRLYAIRGSVTSAGAVVVTARSTAASSGTFTISTSYTPESGNLLPPQEFVVTNTSDGKLTFTFADYSNKEDGFEVDLKEATQPDTAWVGPTTPVPPESTSDPFKGVELPFAFSTPAAPATVQKVTYILNSTLVPGRSYSFRIRAFAGPRDGTRTYSTYAYAPITPVLALTAPNNLTQQTAPENTVKLTWNNASLAAQYMVVLAGIEQSGGAVTFSDFSLVDTSTNTKTFTDLIPGVNYHWKVQAAYLPKDRTFSYANLIRSTESNEVTSTTTFLAPTNLSATASGDSESGETVVKAKWTDNSSVESVYQFMYRTTGTSDDYAVAGSVPANTTSADITFLPKGRAIDIVVRAVYGGQTASNVSNAIAIVTKPGITSAAHAPITKGSPFTFTITTAELAPVTRTALTIDNLPAGLSLASDTGVLSGTPTEGGLFECLITATFSDGWVDKEILTLRVVTPPGAPVKPQDITARSVPIGTDVVIPQSDLFTDPDTEAAVRVATTVGSYDIILYPTLTPATVANFLAYVDAKDYDNSLIHRAVDDFAVQGGGYKVARAPDIFSEVTPRPSPLNEPGITNSKWSVALAKKGGDANSGTHDFFVNAYNNNTTPAETPAGSGIFLPKNNLDLDNGGFTVFGRVANPGQATATTTILSKPSGSYNVRLKDIINQEQTGSFEDWPFDAAAAPTTMDTTKVITITSITRKEALELSILSNSDSTKISALISNGNLVLRGIALGSSTVQVQARDLDGLTETQTIAVTVVAAADLALPVITTQPAALTEVAEGNNATLSVTATGTAPSYQWLKDGEEISGATSASYTITAADAADAGAYRVRVSNAATSVTSITAQVRVLIAPAITTQPASLTRDYGSSATFSVVATGSAALNYQWYFEDQPIYGALNSSFTIPYVTADWAGDLKVKVTNDAGTVTSTVATLTVTLTTDTDGDGLTDEHEDSLHFTHPYRPDSDGDGFSDGLEVKLGSKPTDAKNTPSKLHFVAEVGGDATVKAMRFTPVTRGAFSPIGSGNLEAPTRWVGAYELTNQEFASLLQYALVNFKDGDDAITIGVESGHYRVIFRTKTLCYLATLPTGTAAGAAVTSDIELFDAVTPLPTEPGTFATFTVPVAKARLPVTGITWHGAYFAMHVLNAIHGFTAKSAPSTWSFVASENGYFLPEQHQWEWAARGGYAANFYGNGNIMNPTSANYRKSATDPGKLKPVGSYPASSLGLYDFSGNVAEWVFNTDSGDPTKHFVRGGAWDDLHIDNADLSPLSIRNTTAASIATAEGTRDASIGTRAFLQFGNVASSSATDISLAPTITTSPTHKFLITGETLSLTVVATGAPTLAYQWLKNNAPIKGQTTATLAISNVKLTDAGSYKVRISSHGFSTESTVANVAIASIPDEVPTLFFAQAGTASLTVPTAGSGLTYRWETSDGKALTNDYFLSDVTAQTLKITPLSVSRDSGGYVCAITSASASRTLRSGFNIVVQASSVVGINTGTDASPVFTITMPTTAIVGGFFGFAVPYSNHPSRKPTSFTITGLPPGLTYNSKTGVITGRPQKSGTFSIKIKASNAAGSYNTVTTSLTVAELPANITGTYAAIIDGDVGVGSVNGLSNDLGARLDMTVNPIGSFSGKLKVGTATLPFSGLLNISLGIKPQGSFVIPRKGGLSALGVEFTLNPATNLVEGVFGELNPYTGAIISNAYSFHGWRHIWSASRRASDYRGFHAYALDIPASLEVVQTLPQGTGTGTLNVTDLGLTTIAGQSIDGSAYTSSAPLSPVGRTLIYNPLYRGNGCISGFLDIAASSSSSPHAISSDDTLFHVKRSVSPSSKQRDYKIGFVLPLTASGGLYPAPSPLVLGASSGTSNAKISLVGEGFDSVTGTGFSELLTIDSKNLATFPATLANTRVKAITLKITAATGTFTGSFTVEDTHLSKPVKRTMNFAGQIIPHLGYPGKGIGFGTYTLPLLPVGTETLSTSPIIARQVLLERVP